MVQPAIILLATRFIQYHSQGSHSQELYSRGWHSQESHNRGSHSQELHSRESHSWESPSRGLCSRGSCSREWHSGKWYSVEPHSFTTLHNTWLQAFRCLIVSFTPFCQNIIQFFIIHMIS